MVDVMKRLTNVRKTTLDALPSSNKMILLAIKSGFAFCWGFVNTMVFIETSRFATIMTGNTLDLAIRVSNWSGPEMALSFTFIILYVAGGAAYDALSIIYKDNKDLVVKFIAVPVTVSMGVLSDVLKYVLRACSMMDMMDMGDGGDMEQCSTNDLYFMTPLAFMTGVVTSYLSAHPDGIITNLLTNHMKMLPKAIVQRLLAGKTKLMEKGLTSATITTVFFLGCLLGSVSVDWIMPLYDHGTFIPVFTLVSCVFGALVFLHYTLCQQFVLTNIKRSECTDIEDMQGEMGDTEQEEGTTEAEHGNAEGNAGTEPLNEPLL